MSIDIHNFARQFAQAQQRLAASTISQRNKNLIQSYVTASHVSGFVGIVRLIRVIYIITDFASVLGKDLDMVVREDLERALGAMFLRAYSPATINTIRAIVRRFYTWPC
jgi:hypothetical protein